ncbi:hypothetical protein [Halorubrum californiense]|uniref:hypothetical protein n=1 Tax=Halorubrum californiense TaxID=416585 RepID=UPI001268B7C3|nr:hypothetical protein [Halorubrum californiense]
MVTGQQIGGSLLSVLVFITVFAFLWPYLPKEGVFGSLSWQLKAAVVLISGFLVIGPGQVAWDILTDSGI